MVEDTKGIQQVIRLYLEMTGAEVEIAWNGDEAIQRCMGETFDLVIMDIQMPIMDGFEAIADLRSRGFTRPVIALTAHAMKGDKEKGMQAGFDAYLEKPVSRHELVTTVAEFLDKHQCYTVEPS